MENALNQLKRMGELEPWSKHVIVSRYALADQPDLLTQLGGTPENCLEASVHWVKDEILALLMIQAILDYRGGTYTSFTWSTKDRYGWSFYVQTAIHPLTTAIVEIILDNLAAWLDNNKAIISTKYSPNQPIHLTNMDIAEGLIPDSAWL